MPNRRLLEILSLIEAAERDRSGPTRLCQVCVDVIGVTGAGIMLMSGDASRGSACNSDGVSRLIDDVQYTLGEGPSVDAYEQDRPVAEPDLSRRGAERWPGFTPPAVEAGARAVFGFPLHVGAVRLGAMSLYQDEPQPLRDSQHADGLLMAGVAARSVLAMQADAPDGVLGADLLHGGDLRFVVHQASGMVSVQLGVTITEALIRLRAYAFASECRLVDVAHDVVARRLRFPPALL